MLLTCTVFASTYFGSISKNHVFHIPPIRIKKSIIGTTRLRLYNGIQVSHRLSQGQELVCLFPEERYKLLVPAWQSLESPIKGDNCNVIINQNDNSKNYLIQDL